MASAATLGLGAARTANYAPAFLGFHFVFAYCVLAPRHLKQWYGLDHNACPREDLARYGDAAVRAGRLSPERLAMMKRNEAAQANAVENYALLAGALGFATFAGVEPGLVNRAGLVYAVGRVAYGVLYVLVEDPVWSLGRSAMWWVGNGSCVYLIWKSWEKLNYV